MNLFKKLIIPAYGALWRAALPLVLTNPRLKQGRARRTSAGHLPRADVWIQAASAGEAYLAVSLVRRMRPPRAMTLLVTSITAQGMDILETARSDPGKSPILTVSTAWFPVDHPGLMDRAVEQVSPRLMVLLETELWPGLLWALKTRNIPTLVVNGRMSAGSFSRYWATRGFWRSLAPDAVLAIAPEDARRYKALFDRTEVRPMSNIKYDALLRDTDEPDLSDLQGLLPPHVPLTILASVRREEEPEVEKMLLEILAGRPDQVVALFPRHMHRIRHWEERLSALGLPWQRRSGARAAVSPGTLLLWDTFGELRRAYLLAAAAFVGGSLKPLGGQNFVEPVMCGTPTVTGWFLEDFSWVDPGFFTQGLATRAGTWRQAARFILQALEQPPEKNRLKDRARQFILSRQGGTDSACDRIITTVFNPPGTCDTP